MDTSLNKLLILGTLVVCYFITPSYAVGLTLFSTELSAQQNCPNDEVVWLNLPTGIWHQKGARWYGRTKNGSYVCKQEAEVSGERASLNG